MPEIDAISDIVQYRIFDIRDWWTTIYGYGYESNAARADSDLRQPEGFWRSIDP